MLPSATLLLNVRIFFSDVFTDRFSSYVTCVCNHCRQTNQNRRLMIGLTSHLSCTSDNFFFLSRFFFFGDKSDDDGYGSGSSGTCHFSFSSEIMLVVLLD